MQAAIEESRLFDVAKTRNLMNCGPETTKRTQICAEYEVCIDWEASLAHPGDEDKMTKRTQWQNE